MSQATVYNTLNQFCKAGLLDEVIVDNIRSYFDTNLCNHHHFYIESEARLVDVPGDCVVIGGLPDAPDGDQRVRVDIVIRLTEKPGKK